METPYTKIEKTKKTSGTQIKPNNKKISTIYQADWLLIQLCRRAFKGVYIPCLFGLSPSGQLKEIKKVSLDLAFGVGQPPEFESDDPPTTSEISKLYFPRDLDITTQEKCEFFVTIDNSGPDHAAWSGVQFPCCIAFRNENEFVHFVNHNCGDADKGQKTFETAKEIVDALSDLANNQDPPPAIEIHLIPVNKIAFI